VSFPKNPRRLQSANALLEETESVVDVGYLLGADDLAFDDDFAVEADVFELL